MKDDLKDKEKQEGTQDSKSESGVLDGVAQKVNQLKEQLLRISADFQNYQRRVEKEKSEWITLAQAKVIEKFLPFMDDMDRAIGSCKKEGMDEKSLKWLEGFEIIQKNLNKTFAELGVKEIDCSSTFNPEFHEAIMHVESENHKSEEIVQVLNKGYLFKDKVLRPAKVSVAK